MALTGWISLALAVAAIVLVVRGWDVRLVLLGAAFAAAGASGDGARLAAVVREFLGTFSNEKFVVPICSAMGFAYVLRHTGCERHLVVLLVRPFRSVRWLLVPGVLAVGFAVNVPVISQTSTAVCIGPVVVPLMRAAGYSITTVGACLLLGTSVGGELLNPGAPELLAVLDRTGVSTRVQVDRYVLPVVLVQFAVAAALFCAMSSIWEGAAARRRRKASERGVPAHAAAAPAEAEPVLAPNPLMALVPLVPLVLLFLAGPPCHAFAVPAEWLLAPKAGGPTPDPAAGTRLIGLAMLVGVLAAATAAPAKARGCVNKFFEGAGYGFANVVSLIVAANCFGKAIEGAGVSAALGELIARSPGLLQPLAAFVPLAFAALCGSGMASTQSLYGFFHDPAVALGTDPVSVGALVSVGSAAGRTMSPVSAVALMCAALTGTNPFALAGRVAVPLLAGIAAVVGLRMAGAL